MEQQTKRAYRRFELTYEPERLTMTELAPTYKHPMNWTDGKSSRDGAWFLARCHSVPVTVITLTGTQELGVVFDPACFEQACYQGYVAHGQSMTDGWYVPLTFEQWVAWFRRDVLNDVHKIKALAEMSHNLSYAHALFRENDTQESIKDALPAYAAALEAAPHTV